MSSNLAFSVNVVQNILSSTPGLLSDLADAARQVNTALRENGLVCAFSPAFVEKCEVVSQVCSVSRALFIAKYFIPVHPKKGATVFSDVSNLTSNGNFLRVGQFAAGALSSIAAVANFVPEMGSPALSKVAAKIGTGFSMIGAKNLTTAAATFGIVAIAFGVTHGLTQEFWGKQTRFESALQVQYELKEEFTAEVRLLERPLEGKQEEGAQEARTLALETAQIRLKETQQRIDQLTASNLHKVSKQAQLERRSEVAQGVALLAAFALGDPLWLLGVAGAIGLVPTVSGAFAKASNLSKEGAK